MSKIDFGMRVVSKKCSGGLVVNSLRECSLQCKMMNLAVGGQ